MLQFMIYFVNVFSYSVLQAPVIGSFEGLKCGGGATRILIVRTKNTSTKRPHKKRDMKNMNVLYSVLSPRFTIFREWITE